MVLPLPVMVHLLRAPSRALHDAVNAWRLTPHGFARCEYDTTERGGWQLRSRRPFGRFERLQMKRVVAVRILWRSLRLQFARAVVVPILGTEGLLANLLHVLEVAHRVRPDAHVHVDWQLSGRERGFRYGAIGENVWDGLFRSLGQPATGEPFLADRPVDLTLWGTGKDSLGGRAVRRQRAEYHRTLAARVTVANARVRDEVSSLQARASDRFRIGLHRRVPNAAVPNVHRDGKVPSLQAFIDTVRAVLPRAGNREWLVILATDDLTSVNALREVFGERLIVREGIQRTTPADVEVHYQEWGHLSLRDAEDVLIDTLLLASCNVLLHTSSSITTAAALLNPSLELVRVQAAA